MQRRFRLTRAEDFKRVRRDGKSHAGPLVVLITLANQASGARVGVVAGRTVGNAVQRNRAKRLLREAMRPRLPDLRPGWDLILVARPPIATASLDQTRASLDSLLQRAGLISVHES